MMKNNQIRLAASCRRFQFEFMKSIGLFWIITKIPWLNIKEPWKKLYKKQQSNT